MHRVVSVPGRGNSMGKCTDEWKHEYSGNSKSEWVEHRKFVENGGNIRL